MSKTRNKIKRSPLKPIYLGIMFILASVAFIFMIVKMGQKPGAEPLAGFIAKAVDPTALVSSEIPEVYRQPMVVSQGEKSLSVTPISGNPVKVERVNNQHIYRGAYAQTDVIQTDYKYKIKEELVFYRPGHPLEFRYQLGNADKYKVEEDKNGNIIFYDKILYDRYGGASNLSRVFTVPTPFIEDSQHYRSFADVSAKVSGDLLIVTINPDFFKEAMYPVTVDPTIEINILNVHSHPQQGDNWEVSFTTQGQADLRIIPNDQSTIDDDEFVSLWCGQEQRNPQILPGDVIYYPSWECSEVAKVIYYTKKAGNHILRFEFSDWSAFAYNQSWLSGWEKRVKLTIDQNDIDDNLSDFPTLVYISTSSGRYSDDVSFVFDEVGANSKKIALTKSDGTTQLYTEIEKWDSSAEQAWLWVNASGTNSISSTTDTDLYLYYDNDHADNDDYVGTTTSAAAIQVWDSNYVAVYHLKERPDTDDGCGSNYACDSTGNHSAQFTSGMTSADMVAAQVDGGMDCDGTDDYIDTGLDAEVDNLDAVSGKYWSVSAWFKNSNVSTARMIVGRGGGTGGSAQFGLYINTDTSITTRLKGGLTDTNIVGNDNVWHHAAVTWDGSSAKLIFDGGAPVSLTVGSASQNYTVKIGATAAGTIDYLGQIDEVRFSDIGRSSAWIKAEYETSRDDLLDFGTEETQETPPEENNLPIHFRTNVHFRQNVHLK